MNRMRGVAGTARRVVCGLWVMAVGLCGSLAGAQDSGGTLEPLSPTAPHVFVQGELLQFRLTLPSGERPAEVIVELNASNHREETIALVAPRAVAPGPGGQIIISVALTEVPLGWHRVEVAWSDAAKPADKRTASTQISHIPRVRRAADPIAHPWGVGAYWAMRYQPAEAARAARQMRAAGILWNREELLWDIVEPEQGIWTWEKTDMAVRTARANGIGVLGLLDYWGRWCKAAQLNRLPEEQRSALRDAHMLESIPHYAEYCRRVVERYKPGGEFARAEGWTDGWGIRHWEVWNEPATFWGGSGEMFGRLLKAAHAAIKAADPEAVVFFANAGDAFDAEVIAAAGMESFDGVCPHYYCPPKSPEEGGLDRGMAMTRDFFAARGFTGPYWISESGWYSRGMLSSMARQAAYLSRMAVMVRAAGMDKFLWYDYRNDGREQSTDTEHQFGLVFREELAPKPAFAAYANLIDKLSTATLAARVELHPAIRLYVFDRGDARVVVAWSTANEGALRADVPLEDLYDMMGNRLMGEIEPGVRYIRPPAPRELPLTAEPHYLVTPWPADRLIAALESATLVNFAPIELTVRPFTAPLARTPAVIVDVNNFGKTDITGRLTLTAPEGWAPTLVDSPVMTFKPGSTPVEFALASLKPNSDNRYPVSAALLDETGAEIAAAETSLVEYLVTRGAAAVDGDLADWSGEEVRWLHLDSTAQAVGLEPYMDWNLSAHFAMRWSDAPTSAGLYFAARVTDNAFVQPHSGTLVWMGDNWQLGFGFPVGAFEADTKKWTGAKYSYGLSLTPEGPQVWCWTGERGGEEAQTDVRLAVRRADENTTIYEAFFPAAALAPIPLAAGTALRLNALLNDNDGGGRRGWLEMSPGIGTGFNPAEYFTFTLE